jgi:hypothetical protein
MLGKYMDYYCMYSELTYRLWSSEQSVKTLLVSNRALIYYVSLSRPIFSIRIVMIDCFISETLMVLSAGEVTSCEALHTSERYVLAYIFCF